MIFWMYAGIILTIQYYLWLDKRCSIYSIPTVSVIVYIALIFPKMILYLMIGDEALVSGAYYAPSESIIQSAALCIFLFVVSMQIPYALGKRVYAEQNRYRSIRYAKNFGIRHIKVLYFLFFLPLSIAYITFFASTKGISPETIFSKPDFVVEGSYTSLYFLQKAGFFLKIPFYIVLIGMLTRKGDEKRSDNVVLFFSTLFSFALFLLSGQRSGVLLTILELLIVYGALGKIRFRTVLLITIFFMSVNFVILAARFADVQEAGIAQIVLRRYFFDIEKISGIFDYALVGGNFFQVSTHSVLGHDYKIEGNIHFFIGEEIFNTRAGVPPSFLGEQIIYFGPFAIVPLTLLTASICKRIELKILLNRSPFFTLVYVIIFSHWMYFSLNSDFFSFLSRTTLDLLVLTSGFLLFCLFQSRRKRHARTSAYGYTLPGKS